LRGTCFGNLQRYLKKAGLPRADVHIFRHSAAKLRRDVGESVDDVSLFLDHSSLAVTTVYLRRLEGQEDRAWERVAVALEYEARRRLLSAPELTATVTATHVNSLGQWRTVRPPNAANSILW